MTQEITINPLTGAVSVGGSVPTLQDRVPKEVVLAALSEFLHSNRDHGNGYEWLYFRGLAFGGKPAALSACFHQGFLREIQWNVILRNETSAHAWPTQAECDQELEFVRGVLCDVFWSAVH
jgi:hypothetical protein